MTTLTEAITNVVSAIGTDVKSLFGNVGKLLDFFNPDLTITKLNIDATGIFTTVEYRRTDTTLAKLSTLSGGTGSAYATRTINFYAEDGITVSKTLIFPLAYADGRCSAGKSDGLVDIEEHGLNVKNYFSTKGDDQAYYVPFVAGSDAGTKDMSVDTGISYNPNTNVLTVLGDVTNSSDRRLKKNIKIVRNARAKMMLLRGITYTRKDNGTHQAGVLAQELLEVLPEAVHQSGEYLSVAYGAIHALSIEAIKDLIKHQEKQDQIISALQKEIKLLRKQK